MKDLFSKITFGFLMAQFLPGCIAVVAACMLVKGGAATSVLELMDVGTQYWIDTENITKGILFIFLSTAAGMAIHGLNWMMIGFMERLFGKWENVPDGLRALRNNIWHRQHIMIQLVLGPVWLVFELILLLAFSRGLNDMLIDENVGQIPQDKQNAFEFLQEFYLNFSQFYLHTSYALTLFLLPAILFGGTIGLHERLVFALVVYFCAAYFFLIGRLQISSLFNAESSLKSSTVATPEEPDTIIVQIKHHE